MDYRAIAYDLIVQIGGVDNIISAAHCATRLRLVIADNRKVSKKALESVQGVKGVFSAQGQLQIIFGTGVVNQVYDSFTSVSGISGATKEEVKAEAAARGNWFQRAIKTLADIFVPIIPAIVASGFLMGLMESLGFMVRNNFVNIDTSGALYVFAGLFANTAYVFLPVLIAFSAARVFGGNPFLGAVIGMIMIHPNLQNAWTVASDGIKTMQPVFFGLYDVPLVGYQGHVIPVIIAVFVLCFIEKRLHKVVPPMIDLFVTPLVSVFVTGYLTLSAIGPVFTLVETNIINGIQWLIAIPLGIGSFIMGGLYATTVVSGIHHMYTIIDLGQLGEFGLTYWLPLASAANVAQGGAALAVGIKTRNKKLKSVALPASLSAFLGITEPAIFGVNLRFVRPFVAGALGGACGALYASITHLGATGTGVTGIFGILLHLHAPVNYAIAMFIAAGVAFMLSWIFGIKEDGEAESFDSANAKLEGELEEVPFCGTVPAPICGRVVPLSDTNDETFSSGVLGRGAAILPQEGLVVAPFTGEVVAVMGHAVALKADCGIELLIHVGIDTVALQGKHYTPCVAEGDRVEAGDALLEFDMEAIEKQGYSLITPIIITNSDQYADIIPHAQKQVNRMDSFLQIHRMEMAETSSII